MSKLKKSKCCGVEVIVRGANDFGPDDEQCTLYYMCTKCWEACDIVYRKTRINKFVIFYMLYRILNGLALRCYQIYWRHLDHDK